MYYFHSYFVLLYFCNSNAKYEIICNKKIIIQPCWLGYIFRSLWWVHHDWNKNIKNRRKIILRHQSRKKREQVRRERERRRERQRKKKRKSTITFFPTKAQVDKMIFRFFSFPFGSMTLGQKMQHLNNYWGIDQWFDK